MAPASDSPHIGLLGEKSLHAALKDWYARAGDRFEVSVDGFVVDIVRRERGRLTLVEVQTGNFAAVKRKLAVLLKEHRVRLLHPIPQEKWIVRETAEGDRVGRRKSPKRGRVVDVFSQLVYIPHLISNPRLTVEVLLTREEEIRRDDGQGSWRRSGWSIRDRRLIGVVEQTRFAALADYQRALPPALPEPFTNRELAAALGCRIGLAQKMTYTLRNAGAITAVGKRRGAWLFEVSPPDPRRQP